MKIVVSREIEMNRSPILASLCLCGLAVSFVLTGCDHRYADASPASYKIATALVTASSRERPSAIASIAQTIDRERDAERLTDAEATYLHAIIAQCDAGEWDAAETEAREVLKAQVRRRSH